MVRITGNRAKDFPRELLYGGEKPPEDVGLRGMADLEKMLTKRFHDKQALKTEKAKLMKKIQFPLMNLISQDKNAVNGIKEMREIATRRKQQILKPPKVPKEERSILFESSLMGDTVFPPYDYQWTWQGEYGRPDDIMVAANKSYGEMEFVFSTGIFGDIGSGASAANALGIYFRPVVQEGSLLLWANPLFSYGWHVDATFGTGSSTASLGLYVGRYTLDNNFDGVLVDTRNTLWYDTIFHWVGNDQDDGFNPSYPLYAQFFVDSDHWYAMWVISDGTATSVKSNLNCRIKSK